MVIKNMKVIFQKINIMEKELNIMKMVIKNMKVIGKMVNIMEKLLKVFLKYKNNFTI